MFGEDGVRYKDETWIRKSDLCDERCRKEVTEEQAGRGPGSVCIMFRVFILSVLQQALSENYNMLGWIPYF